MEFVIAGELEEGDYGDGAADAAAADATSAAVLPATNAAEAKARAIAGPPSTRAYSGSTRPARRPNSPKYNERATPRPSPTVTILPGVNPATVSELHTCFAAVLRVTLGLAAPMIDVNEEAKIKPLCVSGARLIAFVELFDASCVWLASIDGALSTFYACVRIFCYETCSFLGDAIEHVNLPVAHKLSSTCRHARALELAYEELAFEFDVDNVEDLFGKFPDLAGAEEVNDAAEEDDTAVYKIFNAGKKKDVPVFAVHYEDVWSPAIVRRQSNARKLASCFLL